MTVFTGPFNSGGGANFDEVSWRDVFGGLLIDGVIKGALNQFAVTAGSGMQVNVDTGHAVLDGVYFKSDASTAVTLAASDPTNDRIDVVVVHINLTGSTDGAGVSARSGAIIALTGTPSGSPTPPALTANTSAWEIPLAQVRVPHGAVSSASFTITTDVASGTGPSRIWSAAKNANFSVFSGTVSGTGPTTVTHGLNETPNYFFLTANQTTPAYLSAWNQNATTVDIYCSPAGARFFGIAIRF